MSDTEQTELFERRYSRVLAEALAHLNEEVQRRQAALDGAASKLSAVKGLRDRVQAAIREAADREAATAPGPDAPGDAEVTGFCIGVGCRQYVAEDEERGICGKVPGLNVVIAGQTTCPTVPDRVSDEAPADDQPADGPVAACTVKRCKQEKDGLCLADEPCERWKPPKTDEGDAEGRCNRCGGTSDLILVPEQDGFPEHYVCPKCDAALDEEVELADQEPEAPQAEAEDVPEDEEPE